MPTQGLSQTILFEGFLFFEKQTTDMQRNKINHVLHWLYGQYEKSRQQTLFEKTSGGMKMKKPFIVAGTLLGILVLIAGAGTLYISSGMGKTKYVTLDGKTAIGLQDGTYEGHYAAGRFSNTVRVTVKKDAIADVSVVKPVAIEPEGYRDSFIEKVLNAQHTDVDAATGATLTTNAYLKSIENALV